MRNTTLVLLAGAMLAPAARAQIPTGNPLVEASHAIATVGLGSSTSEDRDSCVFTPAKTRIFVREFASKVAEGTERQAMMEKGILAVIDAYEKGAKGMGRSNDLATALAFSVVELVSVDKGTELDKAAFLALSGRFRAVLTKVEATERQKQQFYEYVLSCAGSVMTLNAIAEDADAKARSRALAETLLEALTGSKPNGIVLDGANVAIGATAASETTEPHPLVPQPRTDGSTAEGNPEGGGKVVGDWRWISTGSVTNWNVTTGAYAGAGRGMTKRYRFFADGTFKQDALIAVNDRGHASSAYITAEGRYEIRGGTISFMPVRGHVHGEDNAISSGNYDRPMPDSTLKGMTESYRFEVKKVDGALVFVLHLGVEPKDDMTFRSLAGR